MASTSRSTSPPKSPFISDSDNDDPFANTTLGETPDFIAILIPYFMFLTLSNPFLPTRCKQLLIALTALERNIVFVDKIRIINAQTASDFHFNRFGSIILSKPNLSDNALLSEAYSCHIMSCIIGRIFNVKICNVLTETDITYILPNGPKTDYVMELEPNEYGFNMIAVEVKRMRAGVNVKDLLTKTNQSAIVSNNSVCDRCKWNFQLLHVITDSMTVVTEISQWLIENDIPIGFSRIIVTVVENGMWIFNNK